MRNSWLPLVALTLLGACKDKDTDTKDKDDTADTDVDDTEDSDSGEDSEDSETGDECETYVVETTPASGDRFFYYLDTLTVAFNDDASGALIELTPDGAEPAGLDIAWGTGNLRATLTPTAPLLPSTDYDLHIQICESDTHVSFHTDVFGTPLEIDPSELIDRTFALLLTEARFVEPAGAEALLGLVFNKPILFGVEDASVDSISFRAVEGRTLPTGGYQQVAGADVWHFPPADFTTSPYWEAESDDVAFSWNSYSVPVGNFHLEGTFAPDATSYGGGKVKGLADTSSLSEYYDRGNPAYICEEILATWGIYCQDCVNGTPYCIYIEAHDIEAAWQPGLVIAG
jgi:hypothetical protein